MNPRDAPSIMMMRTRGGCATGARLIHAMRRRHLQFARPANPQRQQPRGRDRQRAAAPPPRGCRGGPNE
jgi:hypothetical protein